LSYPSPILFDDAVSDKAATDAMGGAGQVDAIPPLTDNRVLKPLMRWWTKPATIFLLAATSCPGQEKPATTLDGQFSRVVRPFLETYCLGCHGPRQPAAQLDLSGFTSRQSIMRDGRRWSQILERVEAGEMPPKPSRQPLANERHAAVAWFHAVRDHERRRNAGDPGVVLARRLSTAEYNYTIRDLTGVDIRPAREFPVDPANTAGFDNSGETLTMSPTLLKKYLAAAREVAGHMYLKEKGFAFAPHPMLVETDRDKFAVHQIIGFYHQQNIDYADYFETAWRFRHRSALGRPRATLADFARQYRVSAKYLETVWSTLEGREEIGPLAKLQTMWRNLPPPRANQKAARAGCEEMRAYVARVRQKVEPRFINITAGAIGTAWQPLLIWKNTQYATHRRKFDPRQLQVEGEPPFNQDSVVEPEWDNPFGPGKTILVKNEAGDPDLAVPAGERARYEAAWARFCSVFPDMFYKESRGRNYFRTGRDEGRYLSAGFHNVMGYFRDDQPLYELLLDAEQQAKLDRMWREMDFVASTNIRTYIEFAKLGTRGTRDDFKDGEPEVREIEAEKIISEQQIRKLEAEYLAFAKGASPVAIQAIRDFFDRANQDIRWVQQARRDAEPSHLQALLDFAARAYRRPLTPADRADLQSFYREARDRFALDHEGAMREAITLVLTSPKFSYRADTVEARAGIQPLSGIDLASRLSYFLWSSMPDAELMRHAAAGDLRRPEVLKAQTKRMLQDPRSRALAVEFGGNWLDFRDFQQLETVDRDRFPSFDNDLRAAMFEEPVRFLLDVFQRNRSILDLLYAPDTFVNRTLASHYGMPPAADWIHVPDAGRYGRGGLLPMAAFLTKNAPGLRTSPVKRGYWVARNLLGDQIPPPPPVVPELPTDEATMDLPLRQMLERHRSNPGCASCHARFDSFGLAFERFDPIGRQRTHDLGGRTVDARATFPKGIEGEGFEGVRQYIRDHRQKDFVRGFSSKLLAYALGRSLALSDDVLIEEIGANLTGSGFHFETVVEKIVTSRQFLSKRGQREDLR
jgi:mono/diheme cytochrome c family protein